MAKITNYVLADRDSEPYYVAVHLPGSKVKSIVNYCCCWVVVLLNILSETNLHVFCGKISPSPPVDIIWATMIVRRIRGKLSDVFCAVLCTTVVQNDTHTYQQVLKMSVGFTARRNARCTSYSNSACLSVRLSHASIVPKRRHVARYSLHCQLSDSKMCLVL